MWKIFLVIENSDIRKLEFGKTQKHAEIVMIFVVVVDGVDVDVVLHFLCWKDSAANILRRK